MPGHHMREDPTNPTTPAAPQPDAPETPTTTASADAPTPKTYTEAEVNAMVTARLAKQEKALKAQAAEDAKTAAERAKLDDVERIKAEKADIEKRAIDAEARAAAAERRAALTGKVSDLDLALAVADRHTTDGVLDVDALLAAHPSLAVTKPGQTATPGAGGTIARTGDLTSEDFRNKPPEWIKANLHRLKPPQRN